METLIFKVEKRKKAYNSSYPKGGIRASRTVLSLIKLSSPHQHFGLISPTSPSAKTLYQTPIKII